MEVGGLPVTQASQSGCDLSSRSATLGRVLSTRGRSYGSQGRGPLPKNQPAMLN